MGNLYNPDVRYSFNIPIEEHKEQFVWDPSGSWLECSRICHGKNSAWQPSLCEEHEGIFKGCCEKQNMKPNLTTDIYKEPNREKKVSVYIRITIYLTSLRHIFGLTTFPPVDLS